MSRVAELLAELIAYDTRNPMGDERPLAGRLADELRARGADEVVLGEATAADGRPRAFAYARYGKPTLLVNVHLDTVPANLGWSGEPHKARFVDGKVMGLGAADTKGAIAAVLCALDAVKPRNTAILFSGDEEHGNAVMRHFLQLPLARGLAHAIVCEPTGLKVGMRHRGVMAIELERRGAGGHSSNADRMIAPIAELARVAVALDDWGRVQRDRGPEGFPGMCLNLARLDGGVAFNVVPDVARLDFSLRPPPGADAEAIQDELLAIAARVSPESTAFVHLDNPPFATREPQFFRELLGTRAAAPIDLGFWTEAALLSGAGIDAVVCGPGHIHVAHAPDEAVEIAQLDEAQGMFEGVFRGRG